VVVLESRPTAAIRARALPFDEVDRQRIAHPGRRRGTPFGALCESYGDIRPVSGRRSR
jgi:hypothetical protein